MHTNLSFDIVGVDLDEHLHACIEHKPTDVQAKLNEVLDIVLANTSANKRAVMVHPLNTAITSPTVVHCVVGPHSAALFAIFVGALFTVLASNFAWVFV